MNWFDAGVNLLDGRLDADEVIEHALHAGVSRLCLITTAPNEWERAASLYCRYPDVLRYTVGCHPHNAKLMTAADFSTLEAHLSSPGVVAVGECGLDFNRDFSPRDVQEQVFKAQLDLAVVHRKPVYLHERDAFDKQLACLNAVSEQLVGGIAHCFTGDVSAMHAYLKLGLHIGVTGWVCDPKRGGALRESVAKLPLNRLILETDAPYLFPKNRRPRARNNEPAFISSVGEVVADILELSIGDVAAISFANACDLFGLPD
ncbi:TatD family hydrolase [Aestuariibacter sp. A3R04]|uniref:TatD family hydrolase n=1 Tax=Aestuariibacter sp. A3R04 TaxID=2841571 RepID=UPI001C08D389|nr:TatD family hydrolase [Aestuariibacter sp. A3R04]